MRKFKKINVNVLAAIPHEAQDPRTTTLVTQPSLNAIEVRNLINEALQEGDDTPINATELVEGSTQIST